MMRKDKNYWEPIFDMFCESYPDLADNVIDWFPSGQMEITLKVGKTKGEIERYTYDMLSRTVRRISKHYEEMDITEEEWRKEFTRKLHIKMRNMCINQEMISERTGISQAMISKYINGKAVPSAYNIRKIAHALNCSFMELTDI